VESEQSGKNLIERSENLRRSEDPSTSSGASKEEERETESRPVVEIDGEKDRYEADEQIHELDSRASLRIDCLDAGSLRSRIRQSLHLDQNLLPAVNLG